MGKRCLAILISLCMVLWLAPEAAEAKESERVYVALGDSISAGYGLPDGEDPFTKQIADNNHYTFYSLAESGETSASLLEKLSDPTVMQTLAKADIITITIGGNDLMGSLYEYLANVYNQDKKPSVLFTATDMQNAIVVKKEWDKLLFALEKIVGFDGSEEATASINDFIVNFNSVIQKIQAENPEAIIVVTNQYNPYQYAAEQSTMEEAEILMEAFENGVEALNDAIVNLSSQTGFAVADVYSVFRDAEENPCNASFSSLFNIELDFHPNAYGHSLIAQVVEKTLADLSVPGTRSMWEAKH